MLIIVTKKPREGLFDFNYLASEIKYLLKKLIQGARGPQVVISNLIKGLDKLDTEYKLNPSLSNIKDTDDVCVIRDANALKVIIKIKEEKPNIQILAGPSIVVTPEDEKGIIKNKLIDKIIVPSEWVKELYSLSDNIEKEKIRVWASGIEINEKESDHSGAGIVYVKDIEENILQEVIDHLNERKMQYVLIEYGKYRNKNYIDKLSKSPWLIYLQKSESQGLSMFEAWSMNVPTLIWQNNKYNNLTMSSSVSSPYLNDETGMFFNSSNFSHQFEKFINNKENFKPKRNIRDNFNISKSTKEFLGIIKE